MIALAHVERAAIHLNALDHIRDINVRVGVAIAVGIRRQVVGHQVAAHLDVLRDRLAVVARYARRKILRRLDAARRRLDRIAGNRDRRARTPRICIQQVLAGENLLGGIGRQDVDLLHVRSHGNRIGPWRKMRELKVHG